MLIEIDLSKVERGLREEKVKVTRGGKTFYRRQRVGQKEIEEKPKKELAVVGLNKPEPEPKIEISLDELKSQGLFKPETFDDKKDDRFKVISERKFKVGDEVMAEGKSYVIEGITESGLINIGSGDLGVGMFESGGKRFVFPTKVYPAEETREFLGTQKEKWAAEKPKPEIKLPKKTVDTEKARVDMMGYVAKVDDDELDAMARYTDVDDHKGNYDALNWYIRTGEVDPDNKANVETLIDQVSAFLKNAPKVKGKVYRGMSWSKGGESSKKFDGFLEQMEKGKKVQMKTFTSTSAEPSIVEDLFVGAEGYDHTIRFEIKSKSGVFLGDLSEEAEEQEVLFDKDTKFKIKKVDRAGYPDSVKIIMEEV